MFPTLSWFQMTDAFTSFISFCGLLLSVLLIFYIAPRIVLALLWILFLSQTTNGGVFMSFQWEALLLETGFLAIFFAPTQLIPRKVESKPSPYILFLLRFVLFKLLFLSGSLKYLGGDTTWRDLTAMTFHYETQPLPHVISWYAHQLPLWFQQLSVLVTYLCEAVIPIFIFFPKHFRRFGFFVIVGFQLIIIFTGNFAYFNVLTLVLAILVLDDGVLNVFRRSRFIPPIPDTLNEEASRFKRTLAVTFMLVMLTLNICVLTRVFDRSVKFPRIVSQVLLWTQRFHIAGRYGLFTHMTTKRNEIEVQGSYDGKDWKTYLFKWKPDLLNERPRWVAPHQPRLDWQMWFAALGTFEQNHWFKNFMMRLLQGSPDVLALLDHNPFPNRPPKYVRAVMYQYFFSTPKERKEKGVWWRKVYKRPYSPELTLQ